MFQHLRTRLEGGGVTEISAAQGPLREVSATGGDSPYDVVVVGGGQTGLVVGHELMSKGADFVVLDAGKRAGDAWRNRWDSLRLFTPARMNGLPGLAFPGNGNDFITKDELADYLDAYQENLAIPVLHGMRVERLSRRGDIYALEAGDETILARNVVVAMADYQAPHMPPFAAELNPSIVQMHSTDYRNASQLPEGEILIVGAGNSGAEIAHEVARTHRVWLAGSETAHIPFRLEGWFGRNVGTRLVRFVMLHVLNTSTPIGRKVRPKMLGKAAPLVRVRPKELARAGVQRVGRIAGVESGKPVTAEGRVLDVAGVIWCTGFEKGFPWIDLPVFDETGRPRHERGVVGASPGLYFVGLFFLHAVWSETLTGVQRDARYVVEHLVGHRELITSA